MNDPKPTLTVMFFALLTALACVMWWLTLEADERGSQLVRVYMMEDAQSYPPVPEYWPQAKWLVQHRLTRIQVMLDLLLVALGIGIIEGSRSRRTDTYKGFRFAAFAVGVNGTVLFVCLVALYFITPLPLRLPLIAGGFASVLLIATRQIIVGIPLVR